MLPRVGPFSTMKLSRPVRMVETDHAGFQVSGWKSVMDKHNLGEQRGGGKRKSSRLKAVQKNKQKQNIIKNIQSTNQDTKVQSYRVLHLNLPFGVIM